LPPPQTSQPAGSDTLGPYYEGLYVGFVQIWRHTRPRHSAWTLQGPLQFKPMPSERFFVHKEDGSLVRLKGRLVRFLDEEPPTGSDKSAIRTALEVSPDAEGLVQADIGTSPNEIPLNGFLGRQAYAETPMVPAPSSATSPGVQGEIAADASYVYVCTAKDTWKRAAVSTW